MHAAKICVVLCCVVLCCVVLCCVVLTFSRHIYSSSLNNSHYQKGDSQSQFNPLIDSPAKTVGSDFNGDGIKDLIVGADYNNDGGSNNEGAAYIFFGAGNLSGTKDVSGPSGPDVTVLGRAASDYLGKSVGGGK